MKRAFVFTFLLAAMALATSCGKRSKGEVVIYTALDQIYSEPILKDFEAKTGIQVKPVYDSEAAKTVGLVSRLIAEKERPRCDVFWNNEIIRTIGLKKQGILEAYTSPVAKDIPDAFKDAEGYWTGFAARARVLAYNTAVVSPADAPKDIWSLADEKWKGKVGMAYPLFGSTATQAAALFALWGKGRAEAFFQALKANDVRVFDGNMGACRGVASGEVSVALTDSDYANSVRAEGKPVDFALLDHRGQGALLIPNTVSLVKGAPHAEAAKKLIDYLLSPETEGRLAACPSAQIPLHPGVAAPADVAKLAAGPFLTIDFVKAEEMLATSADFLQTVFAKP